MHNIKFRKKTTNQTNTFALKLKTKTSENNTTTAKRYHFNDSIVVFSLGSNITNADFIANAPFNRETEVINAAPVKGKLKKE